MTEQKERNFQTIVLILTLILVGSLLAMGAFWLYQKAKAETPPTPQSVGVGTYVGSQVSRYYDQEAGVVCWVFEGIYRGGISCLPLAETNLK